MTPVGKHCGLLLVGFVGFTGVSTVKVAELVVVPLPAIVIATVPVVPAPTTATICVPVLDTIEETGVPPIVILAAVAPVKSVPLIVIVEPVQPFVFPKLFMCK